MKEIFLTKGKVALVDDEDYEYLSQWKWYCHHSGYAVRNGKKGESSWVNSFDRGHISMARSIMDMSYTRGLIIKGSDLTVDHINHNRLDNRRCNLQVVNRIFNGKRRIKPKHNTSGYKGVSWETRESKFRSDAHSDCVRVFIGYYNCPIAAALSYDETMERLNPGNALLNFPAYGNSGILDISQINKIKLVKVNE